MFIHFFGIDEASHATTIPDELFNSTVTADSRIIGRVLNSTQTSEVN